MPSNYAKTTNRKAAAKKQCNHCGQLIDSRGLAAHVKSCRRHTTIAKKVAALDSHGMSLVSDRQPLLSSDETLDYRTDSDIQDLDQHQSEFTEGSSRSLRRYDDDNTQPDVAMPHDRDTDSPPVMGGTSDEVDVNSQTTTLETHPVPRVDDIKVEYHPKSHKPTKIYRFHEYTDRHTTPLVSPLSEPWKPFRSRLDFELAELMLDTRMNQKHSAKLLSLIRRAVESPESFTISGTDDLNKIWGHARTTHGTGFVTKTFKAQYKDKDHEYDVSTRPLWDCCLELLQHEELIHAFQWDAQRLFKFDGTRFERFIDEPWTADDWWNIQSKLPDGASPIFLIIFADKTRLSSFGTAKGYPVVARVANLPVDIRNTNGVGGGQLVGWLPIVEEDSGESGKKGYVNFKRVVWHKGFFEILESVKLYGKAGYSMKCADEIVRWLFPLLLILCADYEEQCIMALIRGLGSYAPCPICLVPHDKLADLSSNFELRTKEAMRSFYLQAQSPNLTASENDSILKKVGLRDVENVFWDLPHCDPYRALSWDRLHAYHGGLFSDHLWSEFKRIITIQGKKVAKQIDEQVNAIPRWSGLNHFSSVLKQDFADGRKYEDISKLIVFSSHNVMTPSQSKDGFILLQLMRSYLELDMYTSLTVHTETTLLEGRKEFTTFERLLHEYTRIYPDKSWNFPKMHTHTHVFDDIIRKGATRTYNTKPNEKAHVPLKAFYQLMSNFKDFANQILKLNENDVVASLIRVALDSLDSHIHRLSEETEDSEGLSDSLSHISLGSSLCETRIGAVEHHFYGKNNDLAFRDFRKKLSRSLSMIHNKNINLSLMDEIKPHRLLRVNYESTIDWRLTTNTLRVNPSFHNRPRYDYVLVAAGEGACFFAQLLYVFSIFAAKETRHMALILPMDQHIPRSDRVATDRHFRFTRVRSRPRLKSAFIDVESIIRGALLVPSNDGETDVINDEYLVFDVVDQDMWWRMKKVELLTSVRLE